MRNRLMFALAALLLAGPAIAEPIRIPPPGSAERAALLDLIRPHVEKDFGAPVEFVVRALNISGNYAVALLNAQRPGGGRIDLDRTPMARKWPDMPIDCCHAEAILQRVKGRWRVIDVKSGSTDVWYEDWCRRRLPRGLCGENWSVTN